MQKNVKPIKSGNLDACKYSYSESGLVLIEIMISVVIGLLFLSILMEIYITSQQSMKLESALNTIQSNAKSINAIFQSEIQQAGHIGCAQLTHDFPLISFGEYQFNAENKIMCGQTKKLTVRYAEYPNNILTETMSDNNRIHINNAVRIKSGDILLISDCKKAEIFSASKVNIIHGYQEITLSSSLHNRYEKYAEVSRLMINKFYIYNSKLTVENIHHTKSELISGVSQMQINLTPNGVGINYELTVGSLRKNWHFYAARR